eukprot:5993551-Amphidinium_carterae.1
MDPDRDVPGEELTAADTDPRPASKAKADQEVRPAAKVKAKARQRVPCDTRTAFEPDELINRYAQEGDMDMIDYIVLFGDSHITPQNVRYYEKLVRSTAPPPMPEEFSRCPEFAPDAQELRTEVMLTIPPETQ